MCVCPNQAVGFGMPGLVSVGWNWKHERQATLLYSPKNHLCTDNQLERERTNSRSFKAAW